ncbi:MAG: site-specific integrase [Clostridia bacterium]|nr:site-specific integrase [Clostridia bacterium]
MTITTWLQSWLQNYVTPISKPRTAEAYRGLATHITRHIGEEQLESITPITLQALVSALEQGDKPLSKSTINSVITVLQGALKTAFATGLTQAYLADKIKRPRTEERKISAFTKEEQRLIEQSLEKTKKPKMLGILLMLYTGIRVGELLALEWTDLDLLTATLSVTKTAYDSKEGRKTSSPKTASSRRIVPIPRQLIPLLKEMKKQSKSPYVIESRGKPVGVRSYQRSFELLLKKLNIPHRGTHSLRHTFATRAIECGMDVKTLSEILGHKNATVTLNRYAHSLMEHKKEQMNRLGKLFTGVHLI